MCQEATHHEDTPVAVPVDAPELEICLGLHGCCPGGAVNERQLPKAAPFADAGHPLSIHIHLQGTQRERSERSWGACGVTVARPTLRALSEPTRAGPVKKGCAAAAPRLTSPWAQLPVPCPGCPGSLLAVLPASPTTLCRAAAARACQWPLHPRSLPTMRRAWMAGGCMVQGSYLCRSPAHFPGQPRVLISLGGISSPFPQPHTVTQTLYFPGLWGLGWALRPYRPVLMGPPSWGHGARLPGPGVGGNAAGAPMRPG